jgi:hypothetical protein
MARNTHELTEAELQTTVGGAKFTISSQKSALHSGLQGGGPELEPIPCTCDPEFGDGRRDLAL